MCAGYRRCGRSRRNLINKIPRRQAPRDDIRKNRYHKKIDVIRNINDIR